MLVIKMKMIMELGDYKKGTKDCMTVTPPSGHPSVDIWGFSFHLCFSSHGDPDPQFLGRGCDHVMRLMFKSHEYF